MTFLLARIDVYIAILQVVLQSLCSTINRRRRPRRRAAQSRPSTMKLTRQRRFVGGTGSFNGFSVGCFESRCVSDVCLFVFRQRICSSSCIRIDRIDAVLNRMLAIDRVIRIVVCWFSAMLQTASSKAGNEHQTQSSKCSGINVCAIGGGATGGDWALAARRALTAALRPLSLLVAPSTSSPRDQSSSSTSLGRTAAARALAALAVLGGFVEPLRIGALVLN